MGPFGWVLLSGYHWKAFRHNNNTSGHPPVLFITPKAPAFEVVNVKDNVKDNVKVKVRSQRAPFMRGESEGPYRERIAFALLVVCKRKKAPVRIKLNQSRVDSEQRDTEPEPEREQSRHMEGREWMWILSEAEESIDDEYI